MPTKTATSTSCPQFNDRIVGVQKKTTEPGLRINAFLAALAEPPQSTSPAPGATDTRLRETLEALQRSNRCHRKAVTSAETRVQEAEMKLAIERGDAERLQEVLRDQLQDMTDANLHLKNSLASEVRGERVRRARSDLEDVLEGTGRIHS